MPLYLKFLDSNQANREPLAFYLGRQAACLHTPHCSPCRSASVRSEPYLELEWGEDFACRRGGWADNEPVYMPVTWSVSLCLLRWLWGSYRNQLFMTL